MAESQKLAFQLREGVDFAVTADGTAVPRQDLSTDLPAVGKTIAGDGWTMADPAAEGLARGDRNEPPPSTPGSSSDPIHDEMSREPPDPGNAERNT